MGFAMNKLKNNPNFLILPIFICIKNPLMKEVDLTSGFLINENRMRLHIRSY